MPGLEVSTVLFDLDGTLADTAPDLAFALNTLLEENGKAPLSMARIRPAVSLGGVAMLKLAFTQDEGSIEFEALRQRFLQIYRDNIARESKLFDGMEDLLSELDDRGLAWGIVTNKPGWLTDPLLEELEIDKRTDCIVSGDTVAHSKPHPAPMLHACELLSCQPRQTLYLGDAQRDVDAGKAANMITLVAKYGYIEDGVSIRDWGADGEIDTPTEVLDWL